jgi:DNA polymerase elongation subunit (family B)
MADFYTSVYQTRDNLLVCGYKDGQRYKDRVPYKPYLFIPGNSQESEFRSLEGVPLKRMNFDSMSDAKDFVRNYSDVANFEIHGLDKFQYVFLNDYYTGDIDYNPTLIKVWNLDIETGKTEDGRFADVELANGPITCIGIGIGKKRIIFATKQYTGKRKCTFIKCKDEADLLRKFLNLISNDEYRPDVITGWNIEFYDIPFIVNRIKKVLGGDEYKKMSPWNIMTDKVVEVYGKEITTYIPVGVSILDYFHLYKKFTQNQQESYTLDHIAWVETKKRKLDYSEYETLDRLYDENFDMFVDYNIDDINRVADIDAKKRLLDIVYAMAYDAKVNFQDTLGSVHYWDVLIHNFLMDKKIAVPPYRKRSEQNILGGYVKNPVPRLYNWPVSFDFTSLYPKIIETFNISPETLVYFEGKDEKFIDQILELGSCGDTSRGSTCANGAVFSKDKLGVFPQLMALKFKQRKVYKDKMLEAERLYEETKEERYEMEKDKFYNAQWSKKIQLNSLFGALANVGFRYSDGRLAEAITTNGQLCSRYIAKRFNQFLNKLLGTKEKDYVIAIDTDSVIVDMEDVVKRCVNPEASKKNIIKFLEKLAKEKLNPLIAKWCEEIVVMMNAYQNELDMKREVIADKAIWIAKKRYIMNMWVKETTHYEEPELKMMGIEAVRSSTPSVCKDAIKETLKIIMSKTEDDVINYVEEFRQKFFGLNFEDIAFPRGVNDLEKYSDSMTIFKERTPIHVRASLVYNHLIKEKSLDKTFTKIQSKDKVKFCYLKVPNRVHSNVIAAPKVLPKQLNLDSYIDYDKQFEKTFLDPIKNILDVIGWKTEYTPTLQGLF